MKFRNRPRTFASNRFLIAVLAPRSKIYFSSVFDLSSQIYGGKYFACTRVQLPLDVRLLSNQSPVSKG